MLRLDFALYKGATLLSDWWKAVQEHLRKLQDAHNALETEIKTEIVTKLTEKADTETAERIAADAKNAEALQTEAAERAVMDDRLAAMITSAAVARESAENILAARCSALELLQHSHDNADILDGITVTDVEAWRAAADSSADKPDMVQYFGDEIRSILRSVRELYSSQNVTLYDGGIDGEDHTDGTLDGGNFDTDPTGSFNCGGFNDNIFSDAA